HAGGIGADVVSLGDVEGALRAKEPVEIDAVHMAADDVTGSGAFTADYVARRVFDIDSGGVGRAADRSVARHIQPNPVPNHKVVPGVILYDDIVQTVPRDEVPRPRARAADGVIRGLIVDDDPNHVRDGRRSRCVGANVISLDQVVL